ncbi:hypothetical protein QVD17_05778 [Tagetes erecta]|uniref:Uncharacterized protein n=1 Tax=Tagetes erecta TaxID=13708 RepID=A0AAD8PAU3_TARER|nr:hypothetical protein QVD17_05778 [Tagetes erecta]
MYQRLMRTIYAVLVEFPQVFKIPIFFEIHLMSSGSVSHHLFMRHLIMDQVVVQLQLCFYSLSLYIYGTDGPAHACVLYGGPEHDKQELN